MAPDIAPFTLVTGASSGIGLEFAKLAAVERRPLVLVARRRDRLEALAEELRAAHGVEVRVEIADLGKPGEAAALCARLAAAGVEVGALVNNAGVGTFGRSDEIPVEDQLELLEVNVVALAELTARLLPAMVKRGRGEILNVGSVAGFTPGPYMATYFASKAFVLSYSLALADEMKPAGVTVTCLAPGPTPTEFGRRKTLKNRKSSRPWRIPAETVAQAGWRAMKAGRPLVIPGATNRLIVRLLAALPLGIATRAVGRHQRKFRDG